MFLSRSFRAASALAAVFTLAMPVLAEDFTLFIYETPDEIALRTDTGEEGAAYWAAWSEFSASLARAGAIRGGAPLIPSQALRSPEGLVMGGYFILEAADLEEAESFAAAAPSATRGGLAIVTRHLPTGDKMDSQ